MIELIIGILIGTVTLASGIHIGVKLAKGNDIFTSDNLPYEPEEYSFFTPENEQAPLYTPLHSVPVNPPQFDAGENDVEYMFDETEKEIEARERSKF